MFGKLLSWHFHGCPPHRQRGKSWRVYCRAPWKELFSEEGQRYYYADTASSETSWEAPLHFRANEWLLDTSAYGVDLPTARRILEAVDAVMGDRRAAEWKPVAELVIKVSRPVTHAKLTLPGGRTENLAMLAWHKRTATSEPSGTSSVTFSQ